MAAAQPVADAGAKRCYTLYLMPGFANELLNLGVGVQLVVTHKLGFDDLGLKKVPTIASLRASYAAVLDEKKRAYREYTQVRDSMKKLLMAKANVDRLLDMPERQPEKERDDFGR